jgi:hypothetical protein
VRAGMGVFHWAPDEQRILLKRAVEKKTGALEWIYIPELSEVADGKEIAVAEPAPRPILREIGFRDFGISGDGKLLGVIAVGKHSLSVFLLAVL